MPQDILQFIDTRFHGEPDFVAAFPGGLEFDRAREGAARPYLLVSIVGEAHGNSTEEDAYSEAVLVQFTIVADTVPEVRTLRQLLCRHATAGLDRIASESLGSGDVCLTALRTGGAPRLDPEPGPQAGDVALGTIDYAFVLSRQDDAATPGTPPAAGPALAPMVAFAPLPGPESAPPGAIFSEPSPFRACDGPRQVGPDLVLAASASITSARFSAPRPAIPAPPGSGTWRAVLQVQPAGTADPALAVDVATLAFDPADAPIDQALILGSPYGVGPGDAIRCGLVPVGSPTALDSPAFTVTLA